MQVFLIKQSGIQFSTIAPFSLIIGILSVKQRDVRTILCNFDNNMQTHLETHPELETLIRVTRIPTSTFE